MPSVTSFATSGADRISADVASGDTLANSAVTITFSGDKSFTMPAINFESSNLFSPSLQMSHQGPYPRSTSVSTELQTVTSSTPATIGTVTAWGSVAWQKDVPWIVLTSRNDTFAMGSKILDSKPWLKNAPKDLLSIDMILGGSLPATVGTLSHEGDILWQKNVEWIVLSKGFSFSMRTKVLEDTVWSQNLPDGGAWTHADAGTAELSSSDSCPWHDNQVP
jgi:hypothetical protein